MTTPQVAEMLGVNERTVRRWIESGKLYAVREQGYLQYLISDADLIRCVGRLDYHTQHRLRAYLDRQR